MIVLRPMGAGGKSSWGSPLQSGPCSATKIVRPSRVVTTVIGDPALIGLLVSAHVTDGKEGPR